MLTWTVGLATAGIAAYLTWVGTTGRTLADDVPLATAAVWAITTLALAAVGLVRTALRAESTRRNIGRLWDVLNFWPRVTHPFAPPCYGEAIVPMLSYRIKKLLSYGEDYRVLLAGHSQGSVVAMAAVAATEPEAGFAERIALVTYGSPIAVLYERFYRGVFGAKGKAINKTQRKVGSWHHFLAMTEPFAFPLWSVPRGGEVDGKGPPGGLGRESQACPRRYPLPRVWLVAGRRRQ